MGRVPLSSKIEALYAYATYFPFTASMGILIYACAVKRQWRDFLCLFSIALNLCLISLAGRTSAYYSGILIPLVVYAHALLFAEIGAEKTGRQRFAAFGAAVLLFMLVSSRGWMGTLNAVFTGNPDAARISEIIRDHTAETDEITVCGNEDVIYLLSERRSVSRYSYQFPVCGIDPRMEREYFSDVETRKPAVIVLPSNFYAYERMKEIVRRDYRLLEIVGSHEIYLLAR